MSLVYSKCLAWAHFDVLLKMHVSIDFTLFVALGWGPEVRT